MDHMDHTTSTHYAIDLIQLINLESTFNFGKQVRKQLAIFQLKNQFESINGNRVLIQK